VQAQELAELRDELAAQEVLRSHERDLKKAAEEELRKTAENLRRAKENLRKGHHAYDQLLWPYQLLSGAWPSIPVVAYAPSPAACSPDADD
jgi:hypothetical protein